MAGKDYNGDRYCDTSTIYYVDPQSDQTHSLDMVRPTRRQAALSGGEYLQIHR